MAAGHPAQEHAQVSAPQAWPRQWLRTRQLGRLAETPFRSRAARSPAVPGWPTRRRRNGACSAAADVASARRATRSGAPPDPATASRGVWSAADAPPPQAPLRREHFRARARSKALTRSASARQPRAPSAERTSPAAARPAAGQPRAAEAASTDRHSRADRPHVACRAGRGEPMPAHWPLRSSRRSRLPRHRPRPRRSPSRAA